MSSRFRLARYRCAASVLACIAITGCGSQQVASPSPADIEVALTPFPYNTDTEGRDLPVEIGRFLVPADRRHPESEPTFELGFVRYPAAEGAAGDPIVFLSADSRLTTERQRLFLRLREVGDVVVFNWRGHGFSTPPPACPGNVRYPFDVPLAKARLQTALRRHAHECFSFVENSGTAISAYRDVNVAGDLHDLARALGVGRINLVVESQGAEVAVLALSWHPDLVHRIVLVDPRTRTEAAAHLFRRVKSSKPVRRLRAALSSAPIQAKVSAASGQPVELAIGELDYAFIVADAITNHEWDAVVSTSESALAGDTGALAVLALHLRRRLGQPSPIALIEALDAPAARKDSSDLELALAWPASALEGSGSRGSGVDGRFETPALVLTRTSDPSALVDAFAQHRRIEVLDGGPDLLESAPGIADLLARFFRGEPVEISELTSDAQPRGF